MQSFCTDSRSIHPTDKIALSHPELYKYFEKYYMHRVDEWAPYARVNLCVNTTMAVESFHRCLKYEYLSRSTNFRLDRVLYTLHLYVQEKSQRFVIADERRKKNQHRAKETHRNHRVMQTTEGKELRKVNIDGDNYIIVKCDGNVLTVQDLGVCPCLPHENNHCSYRDCDVCPYRYYCPCLIGRRSGVACSHLHFLEKFKRIRASKNISSDEEDSSYEDDTPAAPPMSPIPSSPTPSVIDLDDFPTESRPVTPPTASRNEDPATQMDWNEFNQAVENLNNGQHEKRRGRDHNNCALLIPLRATGTLSLRTLEDMCFKEYSRARNFREQR